MKDLVADYDRSNFGRTEADLIAQLIQDRDDLKNSLRFKADYIKEIKGHRDRVIKENSDRSAQLRMIWQRLDFIIDEIPYQNRTKKETQNMISEVMDQIKEYLEE